MLFGEVRPTDEEIHNFLVLWFQAELMCQVATGKTPSIVEAAGTIVNKLLNIMEESDGQARQ